MSLTSILHCQTSIFLWANYKWSFRVTLPNWCWIVLKIPVNFRSLPWILMNHTFFSCVHHGVNTLHLVQNLNSFRNHARLSMLMHIPVTRDQHGVIEHWDFPADNPWYIVVDAARSRLWSWSWRFFFSECCSFKLVATLQDLSFCAIHFEQFNL